MKNNKNGFTLLELLAVLGILMILLTLAVPRIVKIIKKADEGTYLIEANKIASMAEKYYVSNFTKDSGSFDGNTNIYESLNYKGIKPDEVIVKVNKQGKSYVYVRFGKNVYIKSFLDKVASYHSTQNLSRIFSFNYDINDYLTRFTIIPAKGDDPTAKLFERQGGGFIQVGNNNDFFQYDDLIGGNWVYWYASKTHKHYINMNAKIDGQKINLFTQGYIMSHNEDESEANLTDEVLDCEFDNPSSCSLFFNNQQNLGKGRIIYFVVGAVLVAEDEAAVETMRSLGVNIDHPGSYYLNLNLYVNDVNNLCSVNLRWEYTDNNINPSLEQLAGYENCKK